MAELPVEMPNLLKFPMVKLCYDLVLEVIDELDPKDVPELMKADRRFRGILLQKPARILGKQIHSISVEVGHEGIMDLQYEELVIMKFAESTPLLSYDFTHEVLLLSQVERCSVLNISEAGRGFHDALLALEKAFTNLKQVDELELELIGGNLHDFLWNLKAEVTNRASLRFYDFREQTRQQLILFFINGILQNCKMISVDLYDVPDFYLRLYSALSKTQLELFVTKVSLENIKRIIELILNSGIPSRNQEAACFLRGGMQVEINNLMKSFPEIREVNEPNKTFIEDTMMETLRKHGSIIQGCDRSDIHNSRSRFDSDHSRSMDPSSIKIVLEHYVSADGPFACYLKRIDEKRDCIYVVRQGSEGFFFAKYVASIQF